MAKGSTLMETVKRNSFTPFFCFFLEIFLGKQHTVSSYLYTKIRKYFTLIQGFISYIFSEVPKIKNCTIQIVEFSLHANYDKINLKCDTSCGITTIYRETSEEHLT